MKTYTYYSTYDTNSEPLNKIKANDEYEAVEKFAAIKKLSIDEFMALFNVKLYGEKTN